MHLRSTGTLRLGLVVAGAFAVLLAVGGLAHAACAPGTDADGDGVCDDVDNCVAVANPDQKDTYGPLGSPAGAFGDACEPIEAELNVVKLKIKVGRADRGAITYRGDFVLDANQPFEPGTFSTRVVDGFDTDVSAPLPDAPPSVCTTNSSGKIVNCKQAVKGLVQTTATYILSGTDPSVDRVIRVIVRVKRLTLNHVAFSEPVTVTVSDAAGLDRVGVIHDCAANYLQLRCRDL